MADMAEKMKALEREGVDVTRYTVARLMMGMVIQGIIRGKPHKATIPDKKAPCPQDKVNRQFRVPARNMLWVSNFTYVGTGAVSMLLSSSTPTRVGLAAGARANQRTQASFPMP